MREDQQADPLTVAKARAAMEERDFGHSGNEAITSD
jgi:hypothetical protein